MTYAKRLDNISGKFFLLGFIAAKLRLLPIPLLSMGLHLFSTTCYLIGYLFWFIACHFYPNHPPKQDTWYGFTQLKNQHRISTALGLIGISLCLVSLIFPPLLLPGALLFALSNVIWSIAEYHKKQNPPYDTSYSPSRQNDYLRYAVLSTLVSVISAASLALVLIFPPIGGGLFVLSFIGFLLTITAFYFLLKSPSSYKPTTNEPQAMRSSTALISQTLGATTLKSRPTDEPNPLAQEAVAYQPLFQKETTTLHAGIDKDGLILANNSEISA